MNVTTHHLRCFLAVADELHFGRAAAQLHLSPSTVSEQITSLERRLSRKLFTRSSRTVELTAQGRELVPLARSAVGAMDRVLGWGSGGATGDRIRVGLTVSSQQFRDIMAAATREMPRVQWEIRQLGFVDCEDALARGTVDCAFVVDPAPERVPGFVSLPLWEEPCVLVLPQGHPLADRETVRLTDLAAETFVAVRDDALATRWFDALHIPPGAQPRVLPVAHTFEEVLELCAAGLGVNVAGASAATSYARPGLRFIPVADAPAITTSLCLPQDDRPEPLERFARLAVSLAYPRDAAASAGDDDAAWAGRPRDVGSVAGDEGAGGDEAGSEPADVSGAGTRPSDEAARGWAAESR